MKQWFALAGIAVVVGLVVWWGEQRHQAGFNAAREECVEAQRRAQELIDEFEAAQEEATQELEEVERERDDLLNRLTEEAIAAGNSSCVFDDDSLRRLDEVLQ